MESLPISTDGAVPLSGLPLCFNLVNDDYFVQLSAQIAAYENSHLPTIPPEFQALIDQAFGDIALLNSTIQSQLNLIAPIYTLLTNPAEDLAAIVTWISSFINSVLVPLYAPYAKMIAQVTELEAKVTMLTDQIESLANLKGWEARIPSASIFCTL